MSRFLACLQFTLRWEGGLTDHPRDRGGLTNQGVIDRVYRSWRRSQRLPERSVREMTEQERNTIYRVRYWDEVRGDEMPVAVDLVVFDAGVNSGPGRSRRWLQEALGVAVDGIIGPRTMGALAETNAFEVAERMIRIRRRFLQAIVERRPDQSVFLRGWTNRVSDLEREVARLERSTAG